MKPMHKFISLSLLFTFLLSISAFAAYGSCSGTSSLSKNSRNVLNASFTTTEDEASSGDCYNIFVKGDIRVSLHPEILASNNKTEHFKTSTSTSCSLSNPENGGYVADGLHRVRYNDNTVSEDTSAAGPVDAGGRSLTSYKNDELLSRAHDEFGVDLSEMSFVSFDYLWSCNGDSLDAEYVPLKSILTDEYTTVLVGESLPDGVYYDNVDAYIIRLLTDNQLKLVHCQIAPTAYSMKNTIDPNADLSGRIHTNYTIVSEQVS